MPSSLLTSFKKCVHRLKERSGLLLYTHPQTYRLTYAVLATATDAQDASIILPLPQDTNSQHVLETIVFQPADVITKRDERFGNTYAVWSGKLEAEKARRIEYATKVRVEPTRYVILNATQWSEGSSLSDRKEGRSFTSSDSVQDDTINARVLDALQRINCDVISRLVYGDPIPGLYTAEDALTKLRVDCGGFDMLFISLAEKEGIPARLVSGFWTEKDASMHAWLEAQLPDGTWLPADPSVEQLAAAYRTTHSGRLGFVGSDRVTFSVGSNIPLELDGRRVIVPLLQYPVANASDEKDAIRLETRVAIERL